MGETRHTPSQQDGLTTPSNRSQRSWHALHLWQIQPLRDAMVVASVLGVLYLGYLLSIVTVPMLLALLLAYLFEPLVKLMTRGGRVRRPFAAASIIVTTTLIVVVPASLALTFGLGQGMRLAQTQLTNMQKLLRSVEQPERADLRAALPSERWRSLQAWLVEQQERARAAREGDRETTPAPVPESDSAETAPDNLNSAPVAALDTPPPRRAVGTAGPHRSRPRGGDGAGTALSARTRGRNRREGGQRGRRRDRDAGASGGLGGQVSLRRIPGAALLLLLQRELGSGAEVLPRGDS